MFNNSRFSKAIWSVPLAGLLAVFPSFPATAQGNDPDRLKAAIVFNVLRFVELPDGGRGPLVFCVSGNERAADRFRAFSGRTAGSRTVSMRSVRANNFSGCDVVYLGSASASTVANASARGRLLVGEGRRFIDNGGSVGLVQMGSQVRFEVNLDAAQDAGVRMSSKLVRLAARVKR